MFIVAADIKNRNAILVHSLINILSSLSTFGFYKLNCQYSGAGTFLKVQQKIWSHEWLFQSRSRYITPCVTNRYCIYFAPYILQLKPLKSFLPPSSTHCRGLSQGARKWLYNLHTYPRLQKKWSPPRRVKLLICLTTLESNDIFHLVD